METKASIFLAHNQAQVLSKVLKVGKEIHLALQIKQEKVYNQQMNLINIYMFFQILNAKIIKGHAEENIQKYEENILVSHSLYKDYFIFRTLCWENANKHKNIYSQTI